MERIDTEPLFDSEYFLDLLSFSYPLREAETFRASTGAYRVNGASLDCCDLLLNQELKFQKRLTESLDFKYRLLQNEDKDFQEFHQWLEFEKKLPAGFSAGLFGEPTFHKEDADIGLALNFSPAPGARLSARRYWVDFNFNRRGSGQESYHRQPITDDFAFEWAQAGWRANLVLELDHPLSRRTPAQNRVYSYRRTVFTAELSGPVGRWMSVVRYSYQFQNEGNSFDLDPANSVVFRRRVHSLSTSGHAALGAKDRLEAGQLLMIRSARSDFSNTPAQALFYRRWEAQPYVRWNRLVKDWIETEFSAFLSLGENRRRSYIAPSTFSTILEAKMGAGVHFLFPGDGRVTLSGLFDLDELTGHPWDGGAVRARFSF